VQYPLSNYRTEQEIEDRKGRTIKDYFNFLKHNGDARRAVHGGKGVAARRRMNGVISYEARISKHNIGVRVLHALCTPRICFTCNCCGVLILRIAGMHRLLASSVTKCFKFISSDMTHRVTA
jgi:hypothetical protein